MAWYECGEILNGGRLSWKELNQILHTVNSESVDTSPQFLKLMVAVIAAESAFNKKAKSKAKAIGLMQVTRIGSKEASVQCGLPPIRQKALYNKHKNIRYGSCLLKYYLEESKGDVMAALILYNGGYQQLTNFLDKGKVVKETANYVIRVHSFLKRCTL